MDTRLFFTVWLAGLPGVLSVVWLALPIILQGRTLPIPLRIVQVASAVQSMVLLAIAAAIGSLLSPTLNLQAPVLSAIAASQPVLAPLSKLILPGLAGGLMGGLILITANRFGPSQFVQLQDKYSFPLLVRVLYGGVTEELLLRWGLMTLITWLLWRYGQGGGGNPSVFIMASAIAVSSIIFGLGHLPTVRVMIGNLSLQVTLFIILGNAAFGAIAGYLYWQFGLESAIGAHIVAHLVAYAMRTY